MRKFTQGVVFLAILLLAGCVGSGQPAPSYPAPGASQPDKPGDGGSDRGEMM
jgi:hypothetical protein